VSAPGADRASHILQTLMRLKDRLNIAIIEGDLASTLVTHSSRLSHRTLGVWLPNGPNCVDRGLNLWQETGLRCKISVECLNTGRQEQEASYEFYEPGSICRA